MPSRPISSPPIWKPVTWSRPSFDDTQVLKKPVQTAYTDSKRSPAAIQRIAARHLAPRRHQPPVDVLELGLASGPTGRQISRRLQREHATAQEGVWSGRKTDWSMCGTAA